MTMLSEFLARYPRHGATFKESWLAGFAALADQDLDPIPPVELREGYYAGQDSDYWVSGALDALKVVDSLSDGTMHLPAGTALLDIGCSSGRVLRHLSRLLGPHGRVWGADVNAASVAWLRANTTAPMTLVDCEHGAHLPMESESFSAVTAFSVLTHIDKDEKPWLLELRRVLKRGGLLYASTLGSGAWREIGPGHILMHNLGSHPEFARQTFGGDMPSPRVAFGFDEKNPYSFTVFRSTPYLQQHWAPLFSEFTFVEQYHEFQDVCLLRR
jgi:SAM-dependent methyltransferase